MIVCPNCNHQNPEGATQCEACYTPLPATTACPNCGASVQTDAAFCGQCGFNLKGSVSVEEEKTSGSNSLPDPPSLVAPDPLVEPEPVSMTSQSSAPELSQTSPPPPDPVSPLPATVVSEPNTPDPVSMTAPPTPVGSQASQAPPPQPVASPGTAKTQLQVSSAKLLHVQTNALIELPIDLTVIHIGKPNDQIPPDIDVSGFPNSEIVSRIHADIRVEGDIYYIEDVGSSNGTYINHTPLPKGNRHRLRPGDRISLGKGDQVTFLFQSA